MASDESWNFSPSSRPDARQIATFFLGAVFIQAFRSTLSSSFFQRYWPHPGGRSFPASISDKSSTLSTSIPYLALDLLLPLSLSLAAIAHFISLLAFEPASQAGCAFVVALGGICQDLARLVASFIILFDLRPLISRIESAIAILWVTLGAISAFMDNAFSVGSIVVFQPLHVSFCVRKRVLIPSAISFGLCTALQFYFLARSLAPFLNQSQRHPIRLLDPRMLRPLSLILLEVLSFLPDLVSLDATGQFLPFSVAALIVLAAFGIPLHPTASKAPAIPSAHVPPLSSSNAPVISSPPASPPVMTYRPPPQRISHPFAAPSLHDAQMVRASDWPHDREADFQSRRTSLASSEAGVVQVVQRALSPHNQSKIPAKLIGLPPKPKSRHSQRNNKGDRRIATPEMLASFEKEDIALPPPPSGIPPPPLSTRPHLVVARESTISQTPSFNSTKIYGSDIIRMPSHRHIEDRTKRSRYSTANYSRLSRQTIVTDAYSIEVSNSTCDLSNSSCGHEYCQAVRRWSTFGGSKRRASGLTVEVPVAATLPPPLPSSIASSRPLPQAP